jgi:hypothetical protein
MKLGNGDIVQIENHTAYVVNAKAGVVDLVRYDDASKQLKVIKRISEVHPAIRSIGNLSMHPALKARYELDFTKLSKGQYVEFVDAKGIKHTGVVEKGGTKISVVYDEGTMVCKGPASLFKVIAKPEMKEEPSVMDDWTVVGFKEHKDMSEETVAFTGKVAFRGKVVFEVSNRGHGGCMDIYLIASNLISDNSDVKSKSLLEKFQKDAVAWAKQFGLKGEPIEVDESWVLWFATERPLGITAKKYFENHNQLMAQYNI